MAENPALPLWTDALLGDTQHLSQAEFGAYMLMLIVAWRSRDCCLPDDDKYLAKITRSGQNWRKLKPVLMAFWTRGEDGQLRQKRLSYERLAIAEMRRQQSEAGKSSARKRKERLLATVEASLQRNGNGNSTPIPNPISISNTESLPLPSSSPSGGAEGARIVRSASGSDLKRAGELAAWATEFLNIATPIAAAPFIAWLQAGASPELIQATITDVMAIKPTGWKPNGINYFRQAIQRAIETAKADGTPATSTAGEISDADAKRIAMKAKAELIAKGHKFTNVDIDDVREMIGNGWLTREQAVAQGYRP